jgi:hypothetical protein
MLQVPALAVGRANRLLPLAGALIGMLVAGEGCRHADLAERRLARRCDGMAHTVNTAAKREGGREQRLAHTFDKIDKGVRRHAEASSANVGRIETRWRRQWQRWFRRQPAYWNAVHRFLAGKPDHIERNAILLFF